MSLKNLFHISFLLLFSLIKSGIVKILDKYFEENIKYENIYYILSYKISNDIMSFESNGGSKNNHNLSFAFDGDFDTYWESLEYQNDSFLNDIQITFSKTVIIDRMIYKAPSFPAVKGYGYPIELKIYYKLRNPDGILSNDESGFLLIDDIISERTENKILISFDQEIICDQIKLEWAQIETTVSLNLFSLASEIIFLIPENKYINQLLFDIFQPNDYNYFNIKSEYNNINTIEEIETKIEHYIDISQNLKNFIKRIKNIINGEFEYNPRREFTTNQTAEINIINQHGDVKYYTNNILKMSRGGTNRQPTGIYAFSKELIIIYVESNYDDPLPSIRFSQYIGKSSNWLSAPIKIKKGINYIKVPEFDIKDIEVKIKSGGPIYIENPFTLNEQSENIKIYFEGGILFPYFRLNDDEYIFKKILNDYIIQYNKNLNNLYNIIELFSENIMITWNATDAYKVYVEQGESPQENLLNWDKVVRKLLIFDGIQFEENQPYYDIKNQFINFHIRYSTPSQNGIAGYASDEHIGIFLKTDFYYYIFVSYIEIGKTLAHEIGHMIDVKSREIAEKTNMVLEEFAVQILYKHIYNRNQFEVIYEYLAPDNIENLSRRCFNICKGFFVNVGKYTYAHFVWWDIENFNPGYWGKLNNLYRYNISLVNGMNKNEIMVYFSSLILGFDIGYYFERFGLALSNDIPFNNSETSKKYKEVIEKAIDEGKIGNKTIIKKFWYSDNNQYNFSLINGKDCYKHKDKYNIKIINITKDNSTGYYNISLPFIDCKSHLGFEIIEKEIVIGFTNKLYYIDKIKYPENYIPRYKIAAYDRQLFYQESNYKIP